MPQLEQSSLQPSTYLQHRHLPQTTSYNHLLRLQLLISRERIHKQKQARNPPPRRGVEKPEGPSALQPTTEYRTLPCEGMQRKSQESNIRAAIVTSLIMFSARTGDEPVRLQIYQWEEAVNGEWVDSEQLPEEIQMNSMLITYQTGKGSHHLSSYLLKPKRRWNIWQIRKYEGMQGLTRTIIMMKACFVNICYSNFSFEMSFHLVREFTWANYQCMFVCVYIIL